MRRWRGASGMDVREDRAAAGEYMIEVDMNRAECT